MAHRLLKLILRWQIMSRTTRLTKLSTTTTSSRHRIRQSHSQLVNQLSRPLLQSTSSQTRKRQNCRNSRPNVIQGRPQWPQLKRPTIRLWHLTKPARARMTLLTLFTSPMRMESPPLVQGLPMNSFRVPRKIQRTPGMSSIFPRITPLSEVPRQAPARPKLRPWKPIWRLKRKTGGLRHWHTMDAATKVSISRCKLQLAANICKRSLLLMPSASLSIASLPHMMLRSPKLTLIWPQIK